MPNTNTKITFAQWVKHPTTAMLVIAMTVASVLVHVLISRTENSNKDCMEQVMYLRERVTKLERQVDAYTTTIMTKDGQIRRLTDSLISKGGMR